jgi:hypothetical protein
MSPLPSQEELRQRKAVERAELARRRERDADEQRGLEEAIARYWELLAEFVVRAEELGIEPRQHASSSHRRAESRVEWVEGHRLRSGSVVTSPPLRYCLRECRLVTGPKLAVYDVAETSLFVLTTDAGLSAVLGEPKTASHGGWPAVRRWDRACNILLALEAELEATLLELMDPE